MNTLAIPNVTVKGHYIGTRSLRRKHKGELYVAPSGLIFISDNHAKGESIQVARREIIGLISTWRPIILGRGRLTMCTDIYRLVFHVPSLDIARQARDLLCSPLDKEFEMETTA